MLFINFYLYSDIGEKLAYKLRELEEEKMQLERERASQEAESQRRQEEETLRNVRMKIAKSFSIETSSSLRESTVVR